MSAGTFTNSDVSSVLFAGDVHADRLQVKARTEASTATKNFRIVMMHSNQKAFEKCL